MNEKINRPSSEKRQRGLRKLASNLEDFDSGALSEPLGEADILSLIVDEASRGVDISTRYPSFYRKLLQSQELRQAFVDALESLESVDDPGALMGGAKAQLDFLNDADKPHAMVKPARDGWRVSWERTIAQLQAIFSPSELVYRADSDFFEDPWFTLLRDDVDVNGVTYTIRLEGTLSKTSDDALTTFLNVVMSASVAAAAQPFPLLQATLQWGEYTATVRVAGEERVSFPDVPFNAVLDPALRAVQAPISLVLESA